MILVINKIDRVQSAKSEWDNNEEKNSFSKCVFTSAINGEGIKDLETAVSGIVGLSRIPDGGRKWTVNQVQELPILFVFLIYILHTCLVCRGAEEMEWDNMQMMMKQMICSIHSLSNYIIDGPLVGHD